jgi:hypothetical protein
MAGHRRGSTRTSCGHATIPPLKKLPLKSLGVRTRSLLEHPLVHLTHKLPCRLSPPVTFRNAAGAAPEASAEDTTEPEAIHVDLVSQELQPHHIGPMYRVEATFSRAPDEAMGMSILSGAVESQRGSR